MPGLPAICDNRHRYEDRNILLGEGVSAATFVGNRVGPCPFCGAMASIVDGTYDVIDGRTVRRAVMNAVDDFRQSDLSVTELTVLRNRIDELRQRTTNPSEVVDALTAEIPEGRLNLGWLSSPRGMALAAWLTLLVAILTFIITWKGHGDTSSGLSPTQLHQIEQIVADTEAGLQSSSSSQAAHPQPPQKESGGHAMTPTPTSRPQRGHEQCGCGSRKQYKNCCGRRGQRGTLGQ